MFTLNSGDANKFGIQSFLSRNRTLRILNLEGNYIHDDGAESIVRGLLQNDQTLVERLYLGWNAIGNDGTIALAKMLESNTSLKVLGLGENNIKNAGARALLSAMASNTKLRDIAGLWKNHIDRRFIIFAIRRLLLSSDERQTSSNKNVSNGTTNNSNIVDDNHSMGEDEGSMSFSILKTPSSSAAAAPPPQQSNQTPLSSSSYYSQNQVHRRIQGNEKDGSEEFATETVDTRLSLTSSQGHPRTSTAS